MKTIRYYLAVHTRIGLSRRFSELANRLRRNIAVLEGSGGNIAVLTGKDGKLLIDAGFTVSKPRISPALDSLSAEPITRLINTHWHVDHTDGNAWLHAEGAAITAHENTKKHLSTSSSNAERTRISRASCLTPISSRTLTPADLRSMPLRPPTAGKLDVSAVAAARHARHRMQV